MTSSLEQPMHEQEIYHVVTEVIHPGASALGSTLANEAYLTATELSARYPRARGERQLGSLVLARYDLETGIYDSEQYVERIQVSDNDIDDPRTFDDEVQPDLLPEGYQVGEGYASWSARTNPQFRYEDVPYVMPRVTGESAKRTAMSPIWNFLENNKTVTRWAERIEARLIAREDAQRAVYESYKKVKKND